MAEKERGRHLRFRFHRNTSIGSFDVRSVQDKIAYWLKFMREGISLALLGLALGFGGATFVGRLMRGTWYQVGAFDSAAFSSVAVILLAAALLACYMPARRATLVNPIDALRLE